MAPPFSESQKVVTLPLFQPPPPSPLLVSDKSLSKAWSIGARRGPGEEMSHPLSLSRLPLRAGVGWGEGGGENPIRSQEQGNRVLAAYKPLNVSILVNLKAVIFLFPA